MPRIIDWRALLTEQRIPFIERGPNVKRGELNIRCPFCGAADPSYHLGLNLENGYWACWRNNSHRGKSPLRLLVRLLSISYQKARELAGLTPDYIDPEGFDAVAARLLRKDSLPERQEQVRREFLSFDREFVDIERDRARTRRFFDYLRSRGFHPSDIEALGSDYELKAATGGSFSDRVIIPYFLDGELVTWTARAIGPAEIRYKDLRRDDSIVPPKETLLGIDGLYEGGKVAVIVEGPLDYLKLDFYGKPHGLRAVALSTNSLSDEQLFQLEDVADRFERWLVMMDTASVLGVVDSMRMQEQLYFLPNLRSIPTPFGRKDAGDLTYQEAEQWARQTTRGK